MSDRPMTRTTAGTVRPWLTLTSLGVTEGDLTARFRPALAPHDADSHPGGLRHHGRPEET